MSELTVSPVIKTNNTDLTIQANDLTLVSSSDIISGESSISDVQNSAVTLWIGQLTGVSLTWGCITWAPELGIFCAVAAARSIISPDGINWTSSTIPISSQWNGIVWAPELGIFCAVGSNGTPRPSITSPDGINWTSSNLPAFAWASVTWSPQLHLFAACSETVSVTNVITSPDGLNWTTRTTANAQYYSITWSPELGLFCAVAFSGIRALTSPDGITWTPQPSLPAGHAWISVDWSPELGIFVAVAQTGTGRAATSPDGINWTTHIAPLNLWRSVKWSPQLSLFCAVGFSTNLRITSPDGINWTTRVSTSSSLWDTVTWSPKLGQFCTIIRNSQTVGLNDADYQDYNQNTVIGTQGITNTVIQGHTLNIGQSSYYTRIGQLSSELNIGSPGTRININSKPSDESGLMCIKYSNQAILNGNTNTILFEENKDADNQGFKFGFNPPDISSGIVTINRTGIYNIQAGYHSANAIGATGRIQFYIESGGQQYSALDQKNINNNAGGTTMSTLFMEEGDTFTIELENDSGTDESFCSSTAPCTLSVYLVSNNLSNNAL